MSETPAKAFSEVGSSSRSSGDNSSGGNSSIGTRSGGDCSRRGSSDDGPGGVKGLGPWGAMELTPPQAAAGVTGESLGRSNPRGRGGWAGRSYSGHTVL